MKADAVFGKHGGPEAECHEDGQAFPSLLAGGAAGAVSQHFEVVGAARRREVLEKNVTLAEPAAEAPGGRVQADGNADSAAEVCVDRESAADAESGAREEGEERGAKRSSQARKRVLPLWARTRPP